MSLRNVRAIPILLVLAVAIALAVLAVPHRAEANCYPWEAQYRWTDVAYEGCCFQLNHGGQFRQQRQVRYRTPNCDWGPWQGTSEYRSVCRLNQCIITV